MNLKFETVSTGYVMVEPKVHFEIMDQGPYWQVWCMGQVIGRSKTLPLAKRLVRKHFNKLMVKNA